MVKKLKKALKSIGRGIVLTAVLAGGVGGDVGTKISRTQPITQSTTQPSRECLEEKLMNVKHLTDFPVMSAHFVEKGECEKGEGEREKDIVYTKLLSPRRRVNKVYKTNPIVY